MRAIGSAGQFLGEPVGHSTHRCVIIGELAAETSPNDPPGGPLFQRSTHRIAAALLTCLLAGCSSFGRGVTKAIMEKAEERPAPESAFCEVTGPEFDGLEARFEGASETTPKITRLILVHGIGSQVLGYSERLQRNLALRLGLDLVDGTVKTIALQSPPDAKTTPPNVPLGTLRISRFTNGHGSELLTFELTYSDLLDTERKAVAFDDYGTAARERADLNKSLKTLINSFTDPLAYNGTRGDFIRGSMLQAFCWMARGGWNDYPNGTRESCSWRDTQRNVIQSDDILISTHSLGSRVALDTMQTLGQLSEALGKDLKGRAAQQALDSLRDKDITFFMLANQLPLLQSGQPAPQVSKQAAQYCGPSAPKIRDRWFKNLSIVAFSDPNDILSYNIPQSFTDDFMDSRLCAKTTNVVVSVARQVSLAVTSLASPQVAHTAYDSDDRVLALMTHGLGAGPMPPGCTWLKFAPPQAPAAQTKQQGSQP